MTVVSTISIIIIVITFMSSRVFTFPVLFTGSTLIREEGLPRIRPILSPLGYCDAFFNLYLFLIWVKNGIQTNLTLLNLARPNKRLIKIQVNFEILRWIFGVKIFQFLDFPVPESIVTQTTDSTYHQLFLLLYHLSFNLIQMALYHFYDFSLSFPLAPSTKK